MSKICRRSLKARQDSGEPQAGCRRSVKSIRKNMLMLGFTGVLCFTTIANVRAQTVWLVCHFDTSSIWKDNGRDKFERRFYVSGLVSMSKEDYLRSDRTGNRIE